MKRLFSLLLCFIMIFSLAACKDKKVQAPEQEVPATSSEVEILEYNLGSRDPRDELQIVDASGKVWFTASDIETIGSRYHKQIGRYLEIIFTSAGNVEFEQALEKERTSFNAVIGEDTYATFNVYTKEDDTKILIFAARFSQPS